MAIVHLQRARYRPKYPVIHYVVNQRVLARSRPARVRNPRTRAQQANRHKLSVASRFLSQFQSVVERGFPSGVRPNGRPVGAYHVALGHLLGSAMMRVGAQWRIDYAQVELSQGQSLRDFPLRVNRQGRTLRLSWEQGLPEGTRRVRLAFHNAKRGATECVEVPILKRGKAMEVLLPKWAQSGALHLWWIPVVCGETRWGSQYLFLPEGGGIIVGWVVGGRRRGRRTAAQGVPTVGEAACGRRPNPCRSGEVCAWDGG